MELYIILGLMRLVRPRAKYMLIIREKKRQINNIIEKEREIQKLIYSIKPKLREIAIYNKKPNYILIEYRYY